MKTLLLLRHAKSSWKQPGLEDHDRPLNRRGRRDAPRMGALMGRLGLAPGQILCSTAVRTRETIRLVDEVAGYRVAVQYDPELYLAPAPHLAEAIRASARPATGVILVVGHNPGVEDLVCRLTGEEATMPTAALARVELPIDSWDRFRLSTPGQLAGFWRPKTLD